MNTLSISVKLQVGQLSKEFAIVCDDIHPAMLEIALDQLFSEANEQMKPFIESCPIVE
jgi:hypothetical protein